MLPYRHQFQLDKCPNNKSLKAYRGKAQVVPMRKLKKLAQLLQISLTTSCLLAPQPTET